MSLSLAAARAMLAHRQYALYTLGSFVSSSGDWAQRLAVGWLAWDLTDSSLWLGLILFSDMAPTVLISPLGGVVVDRMDRLRLTRIGVWLAMLQPAALTVLYFADALTIWLLLAAAIYLGVVNAFGQTARLAITALLVPQEDIARTAPINSMSFNLARFAGPALFGIITAVATPGFAMVVNLASYIAFAAILTRLKPRREALANKRRRSILRDIGDGIRYALSHPGLGPLLIVLIVSSFGTRAFIDLLPGFANGVFGRGPEALSIMTSVTALGALTGAVYLVLRSSTVGLAAISMHASMLVGASLIVFTTLHVFWLAVVNLYFVGIGLSVSAVGVQSLVQASVSGEMRGRVLSIYGIIYRGGPALGGLAMGWIGAWTGLGWPVAGGAALCILAWVWVIPRIATVRRALETQPAAGGAPIARAGIQKP